MDATKEIHHEIVIVGGGICGLATALALHRKGIRSVVLERAASLRTTGAAIAIFANGWRALDQLGVGSKLRQTTLPLQGGHDVWIDTQKQQKIPFINGDVRCLKRDDLIKTLANDLPPGSIQFGCQVESVKLDHQTNHPILQLHDGSAIVTKILIGCDGTRSIVADFLNLKTSKIFNLSAIRGLTNYPNDHSFTHELVRMRKGNIIIGRAPISEELVFWFVVQKSNEIDTKISQHPELVKKSTLELMSGDFPAEIINMVENSDLESLSFTHLRYREPWELLLQSYRKATVTVAGDAMHAMGPFLGQGGSAGLEDAVVLARSLSWEIHSARNMGEEVISLKIEAAIDRYVKERRMRVVALSTQTYLIGTLLETTSWLVKLVVIIIMAVFFSNSGYHVKYDCGSL